MLFFGVALSQIVTDLAVTPLERMLGTSMHFQMISRAARDSMSCMSLHVFARAFELTVQGLSER